jgi:hypothetical protein
VTAYFVHIESVQPRRLYTEFVDLKNLGYVNYSVYTYYDSVEGGVAFGRELHYGEAILESSPNLKVTTFSYHQANVFRLRADKRGLLRCDGCQYSDIQICKEQDAAKWLTGGPRWEDLS